jgi:glutaminyl-peptide cyclotransferase
MRHLFRIVVLVGMMLLGSIGLEACSNSSHSPDDTKTSAAPVASETTPILTYTVVHTYPHDRKAFTQGLVFEAGVLYEGTGLHGQSTLRRVDLGTGQVLQLHTLPAHLFGEGVTVYHDRVMQLTWQSHVGFVYDKRSFAFLREFTYPTEGWGMTHDGSQLIMSDGTSTLYFLHPETFAEVGRIVVHDDAGPVIRLNELEYVQGEIYANVWQTNRIAKIDPHTGRVTAWIDLRGLLGPEDMRQPVDVLNGIAYDAQQDRLFVTGKWWPKLFEIKLMTHE